MVRIDPQVHKIRETDEDYDQEYDYELRRGGCGLTFYFNSSIFLIELCFALPHEKQNLQ